jgi:hypothetical protein
MNMLQRTVVNITHNAEQGIAQNIEHNEVNHFTHNNELGEEHHVSHNSKHTVDNHILHEEITKTNISHELPEVTETQAKGMLMRESRQS